MEKCGCQKESIKFFLHSETQKREIFQDVSSHENIPTAMRPQYGWQLKPLKTWRC